MPPWRFLDIWRRRRPIYMTKIVRRGNIVIAMRESLGSWLNITATRKMRVRMPLPALVNTLATAARMTLTSWMTRDINWPLGLAWKKAKSKPMKWLNRSCWISATIEWLILFIKIVCRYVEIPRTIKTVITMRANGTIIEVPPSSLSTLSMIGWRSFATAAVMPAATAMKKTARTSSLLCPFR